jgi:hypothetical protein
MEPGESTDRTTGDYLLFFLAFAAFTAATLGFLFGAAFYAFAGGGLLLLCFVAFAFKRDPDQRDDW